MYPYFVGTSANERFDLVTYELEWPVVVKGEGGNDYIAATIYEDLLWGGLDDDVILGLAGDDTIYGDLGVNGPGGNDQILAGTGADVVFAAGGDDYVNAGDGDDLVDGGDGNDYVIGGLGADEIYGGDGSDIMLGNGVLPGAVLPILPTITVDMDGIGEYPIPAEQFGGNPGELPLIDDDASDILYGGNGQDVAFGFGGADQLYGGKGIDSLIGGLGNDLLDGGKSADYFLFAEFGADNADKIVGFQKKDTILLDTEVFTGIGKAGHTLKNKYFHQGTEPEGKNDKIIYDKKEGVIYYDKDGSGDSYDMQEIASIHHGFKLKAADFDLV
jgi:Ca2+-binding RTX toxin-like protein